MNIKEGQQADNEAENRELKKIAVAIKVRESKVCKERENDKEGKDKKEIPELNFLLKEVEKVYGRRVATTTDFELLSVVIGQEVGEFLSASTLKRLWRYVGDTRTPRGKTLDILSRYIGKKNFQEFCKMLMGGGVDYQPFMEKYVRAEELSAGDNIVVGWGMDRLLKVRYLGEGRFKVLTNLNLKMKEGDEFEADKFLFQISRSK